MRRIFVRAVKDRRFLAVITAAIVRMGYSGFIYYPLLDDYIQYGLYPSVSNPFKDIFVGIGLYAVRPLAGLADIYVWGRFWSCMWVALLIITILHAVSAYLLILISEELGRPLGMAFAVLFLLCPVNFEGSYWISASSRVVMGLFFAVLSAYFLVKKKSAAAFFMQIIAMLLYEQAAVFSFALNILIILQTKRRREFIPLAINIAFLAGYYILFSRMGSFGYRASNFSLFNFNAVTDVAKGWVISSLYTKGFIRGIGLCGFYILAVAAASVLPAYAEKTNRFDLKAFTAGIILFVAPYTPFLLLANNNASFRASLIPLAGLAISADTLFNLLKKYKPVAVCALSFVFICVCVSELNDYKENYIKDTEIISHVIENLDMTGKNAVVGAKPSYIEQNAFFAEHIKSITAYDWALTGAVRYYTGDRRFPMILINPDDETGVNVIPLFGFYIAPTTKY